MIVTDLKKPARATRSKASAAAAQSSKREDGATFNSLDGNGGLEKTMRFQKNDASRAASSRRSRPRRARTFHHDGHVGKRQETTTKFLKTFR